MTTPPPPQSSKSLAWHDDKHDWFRPEVAACAPAAPARLPGHCPGGAGEPAESDTTAMLATAQACLAAATELIEQARAERAAIAALARDVAAQHAAIQAVLGPARSARPRAQPQGRRPAPADAPGQKLKPDPTAAQTPAELIVALREFRVWAGRPSYRDMAQRAGKRAGSSTMCALLGRDQLPPRFDVIDAILEGCGASDEDRQRFATAWRRLVLDRPACTGPPRLRALPPAPPTEDAAEDSFQHASTGR